MARPQIKEENKRKQLSISLAQFVHELADATDNKSRFLEKSVSAMVGLKAALDLLRSEKKSLEDFLEDAEDIIDAWDAQFEEKIPFAEFKKTLAR